MNLAWHIACKDMRSLRAGATCWAALQVLTLLIAEPFGRHGNDLLWGLHFAAVIAGGLGVYALTGLLLLEDPADRPVAFWATRPISPARLLWAKLLGCCVLFGLLPLSLRTPWWRMHGYGLREFGWASVETVAVHLLIAMTAFGVASLARDSRGFMRWSLGAVPVALVFLILAVAAKGSLWQTNWRFIFGASAAVCLAAGLYRVFRARRAIALFIAVGGLAMVVAFSISWQKRRIPDPADRESGLWSSVAVTARLAPPALGRAEPGLELSAQVPSQRAFASFGRVHGVLRSADGVPAAVDENLWERDLVALCGEIVRQGTLPRPRTVFVPLPPTVARGTGTSSLLVDGQLWIGVDAIEVPLRIDASTAQGSHRVTVKDIGYANLWRERLIRFPGSEHVTIARGGGRSDRALRVTLHETFPLLAVDGAEVVVENRGWLQDTEERYLLVNRRRDEIIPIPHMVSAVRSATVGIRTVHLDLKEAPADEEAFRIWTMDASLVKVILRRAGRFVRPVEVAP